MATYLAGKNAVITVDGQPLEIQDGSYTTGVDIDDMTNNTSGGFYEDIGTIKMATLDGIVCVYNGDNPPDFDEGDIFAMVLTVPGGPGLSGNFRVSTMRYNTMNVRGGVKYTFDARSQGAYVKT